MSVDTNETPAADGTQPLGLYGALHKVLLGTEPVDVAERFRQEAEIESARSAAAADRAAERDRLALAAQRQAIANGQDRHDAAMRRATVLYRRDVALGWAAVIVAVLGVAILAAIAVLAWRVAL